MEPKYTQITRLLMEQKSWMTAASLSDQMGVSVRTIKNYISDLNSIHASLIESSGSGYRIDKEMAAKLLNETSQHIPQTNKERSSYVAIRLLRSPEALSLFDLCDELYISMSTLRTVMKRTKRMLEQYNLILAASGDNVEIRGEERNRRRMLSSIIFDESQLSFFNMEALQDSFDEIDIDYIIETVNLILFEHKYFINDFALFNVVLHITIAVDRHLKPHSDFTYNNVLPLLPDYIHELARDLCARFEEYFEIGFHQAELEDFAFLLYTSITSLMIDEINEANLAKYAGEECIALVDSMFKKLRDDYGVTLDSEEFRIRFALHVRGLLLRQKTKHYNHNPLTASIKTSCPLIYDAAVSLCSVIDSPEDYPPIIDDEIAYIAFHIGNFLEEQQAARSHIRIVLNCPAYYDMRTTLKQKLMERFRSDILITNITSNEQQLAESLAEADLILSTIPLKGAVGMPNITINPFLTSADAGIIERTITQLKETKKINTFYQELHKLLFPQFVEHINKPLSKEETIHYMCRKLYENGFCPEDFEQRILEREALSSTVIQNFAIPHTVKMQEINSCMYILINDTPIDWDSSQIQLVIMLCFSPADRQLFNTIFDPLAITLLNRSTVRELLNIRTPEEFLNVLIRSDRRGR